MLSGSGKDLDLPGAVIEIAKLAWETSLKLTRGEIVAKYQITDNKAVYFLEKSLCGVIEDVKTGEQYQ